MCVNNHQCIGSSAIDASISMRSAALASFKSVSFPNSKATWHIGAEDTLERDDLVLVRLNKGNSSLSSLVGNIGGYLCLRFSKGMETLQDLRNAVVSEAPDASECSLFDDAPKSSKKRVSRGDMKDARRHPQIIDIALKLQGVEDAIVIKTIKAVHPNDCVWVEFDPEAISAAIQFLIEGGFHDRVRRKRVAQDEELPNDIQRRRRYNGEVGYRVVYMSEGVSKTKCLNTLEAALAFHADPETAVADGCEDEDDDVDDFHRQDQPVGAGEAMIRNAADAAMVHDANNDAS